MHLTPTTATAILLPLSLLPSLTLGAHLPPSQLTKRQNPADDATYYTLYAKSNDPAVNNQPINANGLKFIIGGTPGFWCGPTAECPPTPTSNPDTRITINSAKGTAFLNPNDPPQPIYVDAASGALNFAQNGQPSDNSSTFIESNFFIEDLQLNISPGAQNFTPNYVFYACAGRVFTGLGQVGPGPNCSALEIGCTQLPPGSKPGLYA